MLMLCLLQKIKIPNSNIIMCNVTSLKFYAFSDTLRYVENYYSWLNDTCNV